MKTPTALAVCLASSLSLTACGGGGGTGSGPGTGTPPMPPAPPAPTVTMTVKATNTYGYGCAQITQSGGVTLPPLDLIVGDYGTQDIRSFFTFFIGAGEDREVVSAHLHLVAVGVKGDMLQGHTNGLRAEGVDISGGFFPDYDAYDYSATPIGAASPMGPTASEDPIVFDLDVTQALRAWIGSGSDFLHLRVRLDHPTGNGILNYYKFDPVAGNPDLVPTLVAEMR